MTYSPSIKVYCCCGQYLAVTKSAKDRTVVCPRCGQKQDTPVKVPAIIVVSK